MRPRFDVAIVGSGPAGAACALRLSLRGYAVALIDERAFPRQKLCGEYLNLGAIRELRELGLGEELEALAVPLRGMRLFAHDISAEFRSPANAWSLPRMTLDERIRSRALGAGAQALHGRLTGIADNASSVSLEIDGSGGRMKLDARYLVGADGMRSSVARRCGLAAPMPEVPFATGGHYIESGTSEWLEMYVTPAGYLAINPLGDTSVNAIFVLPSQRLKECRGALGSELSRFARAATRGERSISDACLLQQRLAIGPLWHRTIAFTLSNVLLVGDAAAFVDPFTGQGVFVALAGAKLAAEAISCALDHPRDRARSWRAYERSLAALIRERDCVATLVRLVLASRYLSHRTARALRKRPADFMPLIEATCAVGRMSMFELVLAVARAVR